MNALQQVTKDITAQDLLKEIIAQLNKDLALSNVSYEFSETDKPEELWSNLVLVVRELLNKHYEKYLHFIYRIDVAERDLAVVDIAPFEEAEEFVAFQILKRIYEKVYYRKKYASNS